MTGKVAIVTGGSGGAAADVVAGYRGRGWAVAASARTIRRSRDPDLLTVAGDITDPATADRIVGQTLERFGRIDTLVNGAGSYLSKPFAGYSAADYGTATGVDLAGFFWLTQRTIADMAVRYGGHVVTVLAAVTDSADSGKPAVLAALANGALAAATRSLAVEYASHGIRVNAVAPRIIRAPVRVVGSFEDLSWLPPLGIGSQVSDVANAVLALESSAHATGEILNIDRGQNTAAKP
jgi:NAD(P)-dependent dehydrogenase (short-subunit alcohol dehydrogenase family)